MGPLRRESDSMGEVSIPSTAYWGAQTQRALENFGVSPLSIPPRMLQSLALLKGIAAEENRKTGLIEGKVAEAITAAADEIAAGKLSDNFPVDVFQTGSGTSWNMNVNEVIANRANELLGEPLGTRYPVHPNDHVNRCQSSNDVIPSAIQISCRVEAQRLSSALVKLKAVLEQKALEFAPVLKLGRTHLQDAVPMTLGQEFSAYAEQIRKAQKRLENTFENLEELPIGGTAVGTGLNAQPGFAEGVVSSVASRTGIPFREATNRFEAIASRDAQLELMGALNTLSASLMKIANDLRLLASGPRGGLGEITLPALQPGSSIMPGKVNPVIPEMVIQVAAHVAGKQLSVSIACQNAPLELNIMQPLIAYESLSALDLLTNTVETFSEKCISGISANEERCGEWIERSLALVTPLAVRIGYDAAAKIAHTAYSEGKTVREIVVREGVLSEAEARIVLDPAVLAGS